MSLELLEVRVWVGDFNRSGGLSKYDGFGPVPFHIYFKNDSADATQGTELITGQRVSFGCHSET